MLWRFELDLNRNNLWEFDIATYMQSAEWSLGATAAFATMANDAKATMRVKNDEGWFNPENTNASNPFVVDSENLLRPHRRVRIVINRYDTRASSGLIQRLDLDETTGATATDDSGQSNHATYSAGVALANTNSPIPTRRMPLFDGNNGVDLYSADMAGDFDPAVGSVCFYLEAVNDAVWTTATDMVLLHIYADDDNSIYIFKPSFPNNQIKIWYAAGGVISEGLLEINPWTADRFHIGLTWNKAQNRIRVYLNGSQSGADITGLGTWVGTPTLCQFGLEEVGGSIGWQGWLSHYRLYNVELTAAQLAELATNGDEIMWAGWIKTIKSPYTPAGAYTGKTEATMICEGIKSRLETTAVPISIYEDVTGDEVVRDVLLLSAIPPALSGVWLAETPGASEAGVTTFAGSDDDYSDLDTGITTLPLLGDKEATAWQIIKQATEAERGFFYQQRDGRVVWRNRHSRLLNLTSQTTITDTSNPAVKIDYEWDVDVIKNLIRVTVNPRKTAASTTVHDLQTSVVVPAGMTKTFEVPFRDVDGRPVGVSGLGATPTYSGATPVTTLTNFGSRAQVNIDNSANSSGATLTALPVTGAPIQDRDPIIGTAMDADSVGEFGKSELALNVPVLNTLQQAENIAQFELLRRKDARPSVEQIKFLQAGNDSDNTLQLNLTMEDRITVNIASKSHNADHFIIGEKHEWKAGGVNPIHETIFYLEPSGSYQFWIAETAGYSEAGQTTYGAY